MKLIGNGVYSPDRLFDAMRERLDLRYDAELARLIGLTTPFLSKMRSGTIPVGATTLIRLHEASGLSTRTLRALMGDYRHLFNVTHSVSVKKPARGGLVLGRMGVTSSDKPT